MKWLLSAWHAIFHSNDATQAAESTERLPNPAEPQPEPEREAPPVSVEEPNPQAEPDRQPEPREPDPEGPTPVDIGLQVEFAPQVLFRSLMANSVYTELFALGEVVWFHPNFVIASEEELLHFQLTIRTEHDWDRLVEAVLSAQQSPGDILRVVRVDPCFDDPDPDLAPIPLALPPSGAPETVAAALAPLVRPETAPSPSTEGESLSVQKDVASHSIRVDLDRLDSLSNLIGELAVEKAQFGGRLDQLDGLLDGTARAVLQELRRSLGKLTTVINALHEQSTELRMVPVDQLFGRFTRLVRDLSTATGKPLNLKREGEETLLDKAIVEEMVDPLLHLVRNAADHGIESPEERRRRGKPTAGTITLRAYDQGDQAIIEVQDDGQGIDVKRVKAKAIEKGLISPEAADCLTHADLVRLILLPGFSTATQLTDISGRGVGMDVVKVNVERLRGTLDVHSEPGEGTRVQIRLPLTVSILQVMLAEAAGQVVAVPLSGLRGLVRHAHAERQLWGSVIEYQGRLVPLISLSSLWWNRQGDDEGYVMIMEAGTSEVALMVQRPLGQGEVVIKPLGEYVGRLPGVAGAAIISDGRIALILDGSTLVSNEHYREGGQTVDSTSTN